MAVEFVPADNRRGRWAIAGHWERGDAKRIADSGVLRLEVSRVRGFRGSDLDFLVEVEALESLTVIDLGPRLNVAGIQLVGSLSRLSLDHYFKEAIDFSAIPGLIDLHTEWGPGAESIGGALALERLSLHGAPGVDLRWVEGLTRLVCLRIGNSPQIASLSGLEHLVSIERLSLIDLKALASLSGIEGSAPRLRFLDIRGCRALTTVEPVRVCLGLEVLWLLGCGAIESLRPIAELERLRTLMFYDNTKILDGDLDPIFGPPMLANIGFADRRHYNHTLKEVEAFVQGRPKADPSTSICRSDD